MEGRFVGVEGRELGKGDLQWVEGGREKERGREGGREEDITS